MKGGGVGAHLFQIEGGNPSQDVQGGGDAGGRFHRGGARGFREDALRFASGSLFGRRGDAKGLANRGDRFF